MVLVGTMSSVPLPGTLPSPWSILTLEALVVDHVNVVNWPTRITGASTFRLAVGGSALVGKTVIVTVFVEAGLAAPVATRR